MMYVRHKRQTVTVSCDFGSVTAFPDGRLLYTGGASDQGYIFKSREFYQHSLDEICYIAESDLEDYEYEQKHGNASDRKPQGYTHQDFLDMCNSQEEIAEQVFAIVDWQHPETELDEELKENELIKCRCGKWYWRFDLCGCPFCHTTWS